MSATPSARPVLLVGFDPRTVLAIARSLYRKRIPVIVGTISAWETPLRSRAILKFVGLPGVERPPEEFLAALLHVVMAHEVDTVIPINDRALLLLAPHYAVLNTRLRLVCPSPEQIAQVLNKETTAQWAAGLGIPVPLSIAFENWAGLEAQRASLKFPLFAKSRDKAEAFCRDQSIDPRLHRFDDFKTMRETLSGKGGCDRGLLLQEYCPGDDVGLAVLMHRGEAVTVFQYRACRTLPVDGGVCVVACTEKPDTRMTEGAVRLLKALAWEGVAQFDFRHDRETGKFVLLEINGRFWGSTSVAVAAGLDFPFYAWQLAQGQTPEVPVTYKTGVLVRWLEGDIRRLLELWRRRWFGRGARTPRWREWLAFLAGFRPGVRGMFWAWSDPLPGFDTAANLCRCWLVSRRRRLLGGHGLAKVGTACEQHAHL